MKQTTKDNIILKLVELMPNNSWEENEPIFRLIESELALRDQELRSIVESKRDTLIYPDTSFGKMVQPITNGIVDEILKEMDSLTDVSETIKNK